MKTVLIVDDEPASRYALRRALESRYRILEAESAAATRSLLAAENPDLLLLDVVLPGEDGLSFLKWLRLQNPDLPVLMVSALDTAKTAVEALQLGAADYLVKGFELEELRQRVANLLKLVSLEDRMNHFPRQLSGGQEQRVAIARAIVTDPALILADEPTGNLDAASAQEVLTVLSKLNKDFGKTVVMVTHDPHAAQFATHVHHLEKGALVAVA